MQSQLHKFIIFEVSIRVKRDKFLDSCGRDIRLKNDRVQIQMATKQLGVKEKVNNKLAKKSTVNVERDPLLDAKVVLNRAKEDPSWSQEIRKCQRAFDAPGPLIAPGLKQTKFYEFQWYSQKAEAMRAAAAKCKKDAKLELLYRIHGPSYNSWSEARHRMNEADGIKLKMWRKTPEGDPWNLPIHLDGVPMGYQMKRPKSKKNKGKGKGKKTTK